MTSLLRLRQKVLYAEQQAPLFHPSFMLANSSPQFLPLHGLPYRWKLLIAWLSGMLMGLTPAPANAWYLAWIALAPLWVLVVSEERQPQAGSDRSALLDNRKGSRSLQSRSSPSAAATTVRATVRARVGYGLAWGVGYHGLALSWITGLHPLTWLGVPWIASVAIVLFCWTFITLWGAAIVALWVWLLRFTCAAHSLPVWLPKVSHPAPIWLRVLLGTALWCGLETLWSYGSLDWTSLSFTQSPHNLAVLHLGQLAGPMGITGAIVAVNGLLAEAWMQQTQAQRPQARSLLALAVVLWVGCHLTGAWLYQQPLSEDPNRALKVGIIQGNVPTRIKHWEQGVRLAIDRYTDGYKALVDQGVAAVLTPEGSFPWLWIGNPSQNPFYRTLVERGVTAWIGTVGLRQGNITQSLFTIDGSGDLFSRYDKIKLVPLGEYIPFQSVLGNVISRLSPVEATMVPGSPNQQFETPFGRAIAGICYDSAFADLFRRQAAAGGAFILTASNNDPYDASMMAQHHAQDVMRAIETDRWAVRATNTGFSGIVDPHGRTEWISGYRTYETHAHVIYRRQHQTLYVRWGNWLTPLLLAGAWVGWGLHLSRAGARGQP